MDVVYLGILLVSIAFAIVAVYICLVLRRVADTLYSLGHSLGEVEEKLQHITPQLEESVKETGRTVDDISDKMHATDSFFESLDHVGSSANAFNDYYQSKTEKLSDVKLQKKMTPFIEGMKWSEAAMRLYSKWKKQQTKYELMVQNRGKDIVPLNRTGRGDKG